MAGNLNQYNQGFYDQQAQSSFKSASIVLSYLFSIIGQPKNILDVGCGAGTWLSAAQKLGVNEVLGLDGSETAHDNLYIPKSSFLTRDLSQPFTLGQTFDLIASLEVAEHLPVSAHHSYAESISEHGDLVLFSGAIPYQGGTGHVSENWPQYWAALFSEFGYECFDILRGHLWDMRGVNFWYKQNALLFARSSWSHKLEKMGYEKTRQVQALVHPEMFLWANRRSDPISGEDYINDRKYYFEVKDNPSQALRSPRSYGERYNNAF